MAAEYDVIVVGGRCAGSPLAMLLARKGYRVLLVDRDRFPSDTVSSHQLFQTGLARMQRWGLLGRLVDTGCPPLEKMIFDMGGTLIEGAPIPVDGVSVLYVPRRTILDALLVDAAAEAGVEIEQRCSVTGVVFDGDRVTGVRVRRHGGPESRVTASLVVGADGKNSIVARSVGAEKYRDEGTVTCSYYSYWSVDPAAVRNLILAREDWGIAYGPTHDGLMIGNMSAHPSHLPEFRADIEGTFFRLLDSGAPDLAEVLRDGRREERFRGLAEIPNFFRRSHGPGWALAGDAGYYRDPITAQGISDAFRDADLLAGAIDDGFAGVDIDASLAAYASRRDEESKAAFEWTLVSAKFISTNPRVTQLMEAIASDPGLSQKFVNLNPGLANHGEVIGGAMERITAAAGTV